MKTLRSTIATLLLCSMPVLGALPLSGTVTVDSAVTGNIMIFSGQPLDFPDLEGQMSIDMEMNHNPATGQITGSADFSGDLNALGLSGIPSDFQISNFKGHVNFSAKPVRRGNIISLSGAKFSETVSATMAMQGASLAISANAAFEFKKFDVDTAVSPPQLDGLIHATSCKATVKGSVDGKKISQTLNLIDELEDIPISSDLPEDSLSGVAVVISDIKTVAKTGAITGWADSLLDAQDPLAAAYKLTGKRDPKTGISQVSLAGQKSWAKGTSAVLNVNDSLQIQTGGKLKNTLKAYGYTITF